jgi:hypothetical protein
MAAFLQRYVAPMTEVALATAGLSETDCLRAGPGGLSETYLFNLSYVG